MIIFIIVFIFIFDRIYFMPKRLDTTWLTDNYRNSLGDPINKWDFELKNSELIFKENISKKDNFLVYQNRKSEFYLLGCYFSNLYIYDKNKKKVIIYFEKG